MGLAVGLAWALTTPTGRGQDGDPLLGPRDAGVAAARLSGDLGIVDVRGTHPGAAAVCRDGTGGTATETSTVLRADPGNSCAEAVLRGGHVLQLTTFLHEQQARDVHLEEGIPVGRVVVCHRYHLMLGPRGGPDAALAGRVREAAQAAFGCEGGG